MIALYTIADLRRGEELRQDLDRQMIFPRRAQVTVEHLTCRYTLMNLQLFKRIKEDGPSYYVEIRSSSDDDDNLPQIRYTIMGLANSYNYYAEV